VCAPSHRVPDSPSKSLATKRARGAKRRDGRVALLGGAAPIVFYSMATSSAEDVPRSLQFPFSRNRLNVAVSRAMCLAVVVASPLLLESRARTIEQMRLINALCRFVDLAEATVGIFGHCVGASRSSTL